MNNFSERTASLLGETAIKKLEQSHVLLFGLGGVGGHALEALCRGGIGALSLVDAECIELSNCNRQILATRNHIGTRKIDAARERIISINPQCHVQSYQLFVSKDELPSNIFDGVDYIVDAIDTVSAKMLLIEEANKRNIPIVSSMGTGNKLDATAFRVTDIYKTKYCPLARAIRTECKKRQIKSLKVVYSEETPSKVLASSQFGRHAPGSVSFVPGVAGMILAGEVIKDLIQPCL